MRVLGISGYHDSSVAVIEDGQIVSYLKEERLSRIKRDFFPIRAIDTIMQSDIDHVAFIAPYPNLDLFTHQLRKYGKKLSLRDYSHHHHLCHASTAFYNSGFDRALTFVIDRNGSDHFNCMREAETVFECSYPDKFKTLHKNYWVFITGADSAADRIRAMKTLNQEKFTYTADSCMGIVKVYETATSLIGQDPLENGKTMGLAAYGTPDPYHESFFLTGRPIDNLFLHDFFTTNMTTTLHHKHIDKLTKVVTPTNYQFYADYAWQVQSQTQNVVAKMVRKFVEETGIRKVCITGGYGLNVVANAHLLRMLPDVEFYFEPLADDSGNCIGAAMLLYRELTGDASIHKQAHTFYHGVKKTLQNVGKSCSITDIAELLSNGKTVAVFNGLAEAGPRALGNRSILFDARNPKAKDIVNRIKKREWYRPFAGMILEDHFDTYFHTLGLSKSENMTVSFNCKRNDIPGVVHVDNTCRVQTVSDNLNHIYSLLQQFYKLTECPVLLNTSFNLAGEPLIETQDDAIECFENSELDVLWFPEISKCLVKE